MKKVLLLALIALLSISSVYALTPDGSTPAGDNMNIFITSLFIASTLGLFFTFFLGLAKLATQETTIYDVLVSWGFYLLVVMVNHLTAHYVEDTFMYTLTNNFLTYTVWTNGVLPVISFLIALFVRAAKKKKLFTIKEVAGGRLS